MAPLPPRISRTGRDAATNRHLATWMSLIPTLQVRPLSQRSTTRPWHRSLLHCEKEPRLWPGFATPLRWKRLRQAHGRLLLRLCQRPVDMAIQISLTRRTHILETEEKGTVNPSPHNTACKQNQTHVLKFKLSSQLIWTQHCPEFHEP